MILVFLPSFCFIENSDFGYEGNGHDNRTIVRFRRYKNLLLQIKVVTADIYKIGNKSYIFDGDGVMQKGTVWYNEKIIKQKEKERIVRRRDSFLFLGGYLLEKCRQNI